MVVNPPDRVQIWSAQLAANDFPPVCAMTGMPAETWRKFRFSTAPAWAYVFLLLLCTGVGLLIVFLAMYLVSRRASGHLPLTRSASRRLNIVVWAIVAMLPLSIVLVIVGIAIGSNTTDTALSFISGAIVVLGLVAFLAFLVGAVL